MSDDLGKLIGHAQWCGPVYQTFRRLRLEPSAETETTSDPVAATMTQASRLSLLTYREDRADAGSGSGARFGALRSLLLGDAASGQRRAPVHVPVLRFVGGSGGCGVTTIVAAMARALASSGDSTVVIDADPDSPLPCHLGTGDRQEGAGLHTAIVPAAPPIFILKRYEAPADQPGQWLQQGLASLRHGLDRILVDGTPRFWTNAEAFDNPLTIVVLTPDFTSLYRLDALLQRYASQPVLFLLNKFDASVSLHEQVRVWLGRKLGNRLLSLTLRRTDEIAEALADGVTVLDYAPDSAICDDLRALRDIVREWNGASLPGLDAVLSERSA